jgi:hypothetical protein
MFTTVDGDTKSALETTVLRVLLLLLLLPPPLLDLVW